MYEIYILCGKLFKINFNIDYSKLRKIKTEIIENTSSWRHFEREEYLANIENFDDHFGNISLLDYLSNDMAYIKYDYFYYPPIVDEINALLASEHPNFSTDLIIKFNPVNYYFEPIRILDKIVTAAVIEFPNYEEQAHILKDLADDLLVESDLHIRKCSEEVYFDALFSCFEIVSVEEVIEKHPYIELNTLSDYLQKVLSPIFINEQNKNFEQLKYLKKK